jgi:3'(2'), 5'-bisphosphate nucleotidase
VLDDERQRAVALAREAGAILLEVYGSDFDVDFKGKSDPVTEADRLANDFLVRALAEAFPDDGIIAEESENHGGATAGTRCWYVDPLDGTKEFIARNGEFSVMLGLAIDGRSQLGVVYQPVLDKLYHGVVGAGAVLEQGGERRALSVSEVADPRELRLVVSRSHRSKTIDQVVSRLGLQSERPSGSVGLKIGHIAEQNADLYVHVSDRSCKWDACGPEAILRAAGGRFTDLGGRAFEYRGEDMQNRGGILACNAAAFDAVLPAVREVGRDAGYV